MKQINIFYATFIILVCASSFGAEIQTATNSSSVKSQPVPRLSNKVFVWDSSTKIKAVPSNENPAQFTFSFTNVSSNAVTILAVKPSCTCTTAQLPPLPLKIAPGGNGRIGITVNLTGKSGTLFKSVLVITDKGNKLLSVKILTHTTTQSPKI